MKKIARFCAVFLAAAAVLAFSGCSARTAVSADGFQERAKSAGYTVAAVTDDNSLADKVLSAKKNGTDVEIRYYSFKTADSAINWYSTEKDNLPEDGKTVVDSDAYNKYTVSNGEIHYMIIRMDNTGILCKTTLQNESEADSFVKSLKY